MGLLFSVLLLLHKLILFASIGGYYGVFVSYTIACFFLSHLSFFFLCTLFLLQSDLTPPPPFPFTPPIRSAEASNKYQISKPTVCSVHPGELLKLSCPLPSTGTITWTKDGSSLGTNNRTLIEQEVLQIRDATPKDSGLYACTSVSKDTVCFIVNVTGESGIRQDRSGWDRKCGDVQQCAGSFRGTDVIRDGHPDFWATVGSSLCVRVCVCMCNYSSIRPDSEKTPHSCIFFRVCDSMKNSACNTTCVYAGCGGMAVTVVTLYRCNFVGRWWGRYRAIGGHRGGRRADTWVWEEKKRSDAWAVLSFHTIRPSPDELHIVNKPVGPPFICHDGVLRLICQSSIRI